MWIYKEEELKEVPENAVGFIYIIYNLKNGRKYLGKKLFTKAGFETKILKNGNKKKVKCRKESDWKNYFSSCDELKEDVKKLGKQNFKREIIDIAYSLYTHSYLETKYLFKYEVLEDEIWYNGNIAGKYYKGNILGKLF